MTHKGTWLLRKRTCPRSATARLAAMSSWIAGTSNFMKGILRTRSGSGFKDTSTRCATESRSGGIDFWESAQKLVDFEEKTEGEAANGGGGRKEGVKQASSSAQRCGFVHGRGCMYCTGRDSLCNTRNKDWSATFAFTRRARSLLELELVPTSYN